MEVPSGMSQTDVRGGSRRAWTPGPESAAASDGWRSWDDDFLLSWIEALPAEHSADDELLEVVGSDRHFFIRQLAAKRLSDAQRLKPFAGDRHVGQILARRLSRAEDVEYLRSLKSDSRFVEVRRAAAAQLQDLMAQGVHKAAQ